MVGRHQSRPPIIATRPSRSSRGSNLALGLSSLREGEPKNSANRAVRSGHARDYADSLRCRSAHSGQAAPRRPAHERPRARPGHRVRQHAHSCSCRRSSPFDPIDGVEAPRPGDRRRDPGADLAGRSGPGSDARRTRTAREGESSASRGLLRDIALGPAPGGPASCSNRVPRGTSPLDRKARDQAAQSADPQA